MKQTIFRAPFLATSSWRVGNQMNPIIKRAAWTLRPGDAESHYCFDLVKKRPLWSKPPVCSFVAAA